jgi:hypothetical protein
LGLRGCSFVDWRAIVGGKSVAGLGEGEGETSVAVEAGARYDIWCIMTNTPDSGVGFKLRGESLHTADAFECRVK